VDLAALLAHALDAVRTDAALQGIALTVVEPVAGPVLALGHAEPLRQALVNLLLNAAEAGARRVELGVERDGTRCRVHVADDGPGIPASRREVVFDPFWTTKPRGTGLGLAFVRRVAEAAGGTAWVAEPPAPHALRGARIVMELPGGAQ
jgi:signal transduction histidine kinase